MSEQRHHPQLEAEQARDRRTDMWAWLAVIIITLGFFLVDIVSEMTDGTYAGDPARWHQFVFFDGSSIVVLFALFPVLLWLTRRWPLSLQEWKSVLPIYALASVGWSGLHIAGMVTIRKVLYPVLFEGQYSFSRAGGFWLELLYEYRKDLLTFILYLAVIYAFRHMAELRREVETARAEAGRSSRITLKSGGSMIFLDAHAVDWARAAGNYVEISAGGKMHLARITLTALDEQLQASGADIVRTHRSWLVNKARLREVRPTGDGDQIAILQFGEEVPVSRRYRDALSLS
ncbi:LytTR family transcriptional regulator [Parvularcula flava]|uniref:LytTR family transcriptional regulator n=1 Tax=Aquisalinus luteolus TaxID=1566827 RepID=A0A8J3A1Q9_9PROT|nr:LytTR family DNA-binding domain-containing protein [Aquisalinus luteolus]NHK27793.1 LytTR family transcriptional regulator [Aquisalinus luteolus]GGH96519.1 hypothetical protein GCM10011355_15610 [Aquisalinus luteolus]